MILWIGILFVYHKLWQGPTNRNAFLPQCKAAFWYSSRMVFYQLKLFRHGKPRDRLCCLYGQNRRKGVRRRSGCHTCMGTFPKPLTAMYAAAPLQ